MMVIKILPSEAPPSDFPPTDHMSMKHSSVTAQIGKPKTFT